MGFLSRLFRGRGYTTVNKSQLQKLLNNSNILIIDIGCTGNGTIYIFYFINCSNNKNQPDFVTR